MADLIPEFAAIDKGEITIHDLLIHQSGRLADNPLADYADGPETAMKRICQLKLLNQVGTKFVYSDVIFIVRGEILRRVSGKNLHEFSRENLFRPLGMTATGSLPDEPLRARAAPTVVATAIRDPNK